ncbi:MAG: citrate/2-methylcitrate synthase, partial [Anaerolineaceae bacterium]
MAELWETSLTRIQPNEIRLRGYRIDELMGKMSFSQVIYLLFTGELPAKPVSDLLDAIFISSIDHGVTPPSALAVRNAVSTGAPLNAAVASGILCINDFHGGAIFNAMGELQNAIKQTGDDQAIEIAAKELVSGWLKTKRRFPGVGHRIHTDDPRTKKLFELADAAGVSASGVRMMKAIAGEFAAQGKALPVNVDGAIAAILID